MDPKHPGCIRSISEEGFEKLGWTPLEAVGRNIEIFLPDGLRQLVSDALRTHISSGNSDFLYKTRMGFVQHQMGYVLPALIHITPHPSLEEEFIYVVVIRIVEIMRI